MGIQIADRILKFRDIPILFISSYSENQLLNRVSRIKHYGFIPKLSSPAVLECMVKSALRLFEARQEVSLREKELRATFDSIGDAVIVTDPQGNIVKVNPATNLPATDYRILPRIPLGDIDGNPNMEQNFGY